MNKQQQDESLGSHLNPEEKELHKKDDWHAKKLSKHREPDAIYRETEPHGVVGKEIVEGLCQEKIVEGQQTQQGQQGQGMSQEGKQDKLL